MLFRVLFTSCVSLVSMWRSGSRILAVAGVFAYLIRENVLNETLRARCVCNGVLTKLVSNVQTNLLLFAFLAGTNKSLLGRSEHSSAVVGRRKQVRFEPCLAP